MKENKSYVRAANLIAKAKKMREQVKKLEDEANRLLGNGGILSYGTAENNGKTQYCFEIALHDYLAQWPAAKPEMKTTTKGDRAWMQYPYQYCGDDANVTVFVDARTPFVEIPKPATADTVEAA